MQHTPCLPFLRLSKSKYARVLKKEANPAPAAGLISQITCHSVSVAPAAPASMSLTFPWHAHQTQLSRISRDVGPRTVSLSYLLRSEVPQTEFELLSVEVRLSPSMLTLRKGKQSVL